MPHIDSDAVTRTKRILRGESIELKSVRALVRQLKKEKAFGYARRLLGHVLIEPPAEAALRLQLFQEQALCTYKDPDLPAHDRLDQALRILELADDLHGTKNQETLGLAGAIHKRRWELDGQRVHLERSLGFYRRGYDEEPVRDYGYTGINAAFVLDLLASLEEGAFTEAGLDASRRTVEELRAEAQAIRENLVQDLSPLWDSPDHAFLKTEWWFVATVAEAHFGLRRYDETSMWLKKRSPDTADWEVESTARQLAGLARLQDGGAGSTEGSEAWSVLRGLLGERIEAMRCAFGGKLGLALSGGGFRASLFHIGVLARLAEVGLLHRIEVLSCVSGGSIVGAHLYLEVRNLLEKKPEAQLEVPDYIAIVARMEADFFAGVERNIRTRILAEPLTNLRMIFSGYSRTQRVGELYESEIYRRVNDGKGSAPRYLDELLIVPAGEPETFAPKLHNWRREFKTPILVLNATTLNTGHVWQFTASWMGEPPAAIEEEIDANYRLRRLYYDQAPPRYRHVRLGHAVAASSCVPGLFEPLTLPGLYRNEEGEEITVSLVDGGVHDNQGVASLLEQDCTVILVSDASGQMTTIDTPRHGALPVSLRSNSILMARVRTAQFRELESRRRASLLRARPFVHLKKEMRVEPLDWIDCQDPQDPSVKQVEGLTSYGMPKDLQRLLAGIRTDLDSFTEVEAYTLMLSGYRMMTHELEVVMPQYRPEENYRPTWRFLEIEPVLHAPSSDPLRQKVERVLDVASGRAFKVWRLYPPLRWVSWTLGAAAVAGVGILYTSGGGVTFRFTTREIATWTAVLVVSRVVGVRVLRWIRCRQTLTQVLTGLGMGTLGWSIARLHISTFDRLYKRLGRI